MGKLLTGFGKKRIEKLMDELIAEGRKLIHAGWTKEQVIKFVERLLKPKKKEG